jgi:non-heme chloroperoxidase
MNIQQLIVYKPHKIKLEYTVLGEGAPVLFLHGGGVDFKTYKDLLEELAKFFKLYNFSYPGFGKSSKMNAYTASNFNDLIDAFITELDLQNFSIIGHSTGGALALSYASYNSTKINKVIAMSPSIFPIQKTFTKMLNDLVIQPVQERKFYDVRKTNSERPNLLIQYIRKIREANKTINALRIFYFLKKTDFSLILQDIINPTLGFIGEKDIVLDPIKQKEGFALIKKCKVITYPEYGHNYWSYKRVEVVEEIQKFISNP